MSHDEGADSDIAFAEVASPRSSAERGSPAEHANASCSSNRMVSPGRPPRTAPRFARTDATLALSPPPQKLHPSSDENETSTNAGDADDSVLFIVTAIPPEASPSRSPSMAPSLSSSSSCVEFDAEATEVPLRTEPLGQNRSMSDSEPVVIASSDDDEDDDDDDVNNGHGGVMAAAAAPLEIHKAKPSVSRASDSNDSIRFERNDDDDDNDASSDNRPLDSQHPTAVAPINIPSSLAAVVKPRSTPTTPDFSADDPDGFVEGESEASVTSEPPCVTEDPIDAAMVRNAAGTHVGATKPCEPPPQLEQIDSKRAFLHSPASPLSDLHSTIRASPKKLLVPEKANGIHPQPWQSPGKTPRKSGPSSASVTESVRSSSIVSSTSAIALTTTATSSLRRSKQTSLPPPKRSGVGSSKRHSNVDDVELSPRSLVSSENERVVPPVLQSEVRASAAYQSDSDDGSASRHRSASSVGGRHLSMHWDAHRDEQVATPRYMQSTTSTRQRQEVAFETPAELDSKRRELLLLHGARRGEELFQHHVGRLKQVSHHAPSRDRTSPVTARSSRNPTPTRRSTPLQTRDRDSNSAERERLGGEHRGSVPRTRPSHEESRIWDRLYQTPLRHNKLSNSPLRQERPVAPPAVTAKLRSASPPIFDRLYRGGLDDKSRRDKIYLEGQVKRLQQELQESMEHAVMARLIRSPNDGHHHHPLPSQDVVQVALQRERERLAASIEMVAAQQQQHHDPKADASRKATTSPLLRLDVVSSIKFSAEPRLSPERIDELSARLYRHGRRRYAEEEKVKAQQELKECTFHPNIRGRSNSRHGSTQGGRIAVTPGHRQNSVDRCRQLYEFSKQEKNAQKLLREQALQNRKQRILREKMDNDHHFRRRVKQDPSLADKFIASLPDDV